VNLEALTEVSTLLANALALGVGLYALGKVAVRALKKNLTIQVCLPSRVKKTWILCSEIMWPGACCPRV
jgi:hypothetical protein